MGVALLVGAFLWSATVVLSRKGRIGSQQKIEIRFAHWQLESGLREAFDRVAKDYMALHPEVDVKQVAVPGRAYPTWLQAGYVSGMLPDLVVLPGASDETLSAHFAPMTGEVVKPNPYNAGTSLEGVPWRETFLDGLAKSSGLSTLQEYYSAPSAVMTVRMYYNRPIWRKIFGNEKPPATYGEFIEASKAILDYAARTGKPLVPVAGSNLTANILLGELFASQTQKRALELDRLHSLAAFSGLAPNALLEGFSSLDDPPIRDGLSLMREAGNLMQSGFMQLERDEAILYFAQQRAVMLPTGVWDYGSIVEQSDFEVGVFPMPLPDEATPRYGKNILGKASEVASGTALDFLLSANSKHPEVAMDFLKFLTSQRENQIFAQISKWPPGIVGVEQATETSAFAPVKEGVTPGFRIADLAFGAGDVYLLHSQNIYKLFGDSGSVEKFVEAIRPQFAAALRSDLDRGFKGQKVSSQRMDSLLAAMAIMQSGGDSHAAEKFAALLQAQNAQESAMGLMENRLREQKEKHP
jgi:raffinose/stachyose/melibiose transport system substrate-binding protein